MIVSHAPIIAPQTAAKLIFISKPKFWLICSLLMLFCVFSVRAGATETQCASFSSLQVSSEILQSDPLTVRCALQERAQEEEESVVTKWLKITDSYQRGDYPQFIARAQELVDDPAVDDENRANLYAQMIGSHARLGQHEAAQDTIKAMCRVGLLGAGAVWPSPPLSIAAIEGGWPATTLMPGKIVLKTQRRGRHRTVVMATSNTIAAPVLLDTGSEVSGMSESVAAALGVESYHVYLVDVDRTDVYGQPAPQGGMKRVEVGLGLLPELAFGDACSEQHRGCGFAR